MRHSFLYITVLLATGTFVLVPLGAPQAYGAETAAMIITAHEASDLRVGDQLPITLDLHAVESVNAIQGRLVFDPAYLTLEGVDTASSIVPLWIDLPRPASLATVNQDGGFSFAGIMPGGIAGLNGDEGLSLIFRTRRAGTTPVVLQEAAFLLNDGKGTTLLAAAAPHTVTIGDESSQEAPPVESSDNLPPAPFSLERSRSASIFDGRWFVSFGTRDSETSVDRYEIAECRRACSADPPPSFAWRSARSPYLLRDQSLRSTVYVKAIDRGGNARVTSLPPEGSGTSRAQLWIVALLLVLGSVVVLVYKRR